MKESSMHTVCNPKKLRPGDIIWVKGAVQVPGMYKEHECEERKFRVIKLYKDYVLCEVMNGAGYKECFQYSVLSHKMTRVKRGEADVQKRSDSSKNEQRRNQEKKRAG